MYIGKNDYATPRWAFEVLAMAAFAALGYNVYQVVIDVSKMKTVRPEEDKAASSPVMSGR